MNLARKVEYRGQYWAQRTDGSWVRWSALAGEWIEQLQGPPFDTYEGPGFAAAVPTPALAGAGGASPPGRGLMPGAPDPMDRPLPDMYRETNPVDRWWNREFPPHSKKRLVFFLFALPVMAVLIALMREITGRAPMTWGQFWFVVVAGDAVLALLWLTGSLRPDEFDGRAVRKPRKSNVLNDFLVSISISFVGVTLMGLIMWPDNALEPQSLLTTATTAFLFSLLMILRRTVWSVIILSVLVGFGCAIFFELFFMFLGDSDGLLVSWIVFSVLAFSFFFPPWYRLRKMGFMGGHKEPRLWVLVTGTFLIAVTATFFMQSEYKSEASATEAYGDVEVPPISGHAPIGAGTEEGAARGFFGAWAAGFSERAAVFGTERAVDQMFKFAPGKGRLLGCGTIPAGYTRCVIEFPDKLVLLAPEIDYGEGAQFYIDYVETAPLGTPITYRAAPTPQPTQPSQAATPDY